jgi:hypothetical protein
VTSTVSIWLARVGYTYTSFYFIATSHYHRSLTWIVWNKNMYVPMSPPPPIFTSNNNRSTTLHVGDSSPSNSIYDRYSAAAKRYKYLRRLLKFRQMDFEFAIWQIIHLFIAPQKVFRAFQYRKRRTRMWCIDHWVCILFFIRNEKSMGKRWSRFSGASHDFSHW